MEKYFAETYLPIFIIAFLLTDWKVIFFLEAADFSAVSPKFVNLFYRHNLSSWSGFKIFNYCFSAQSGQSLFNIMTTSLTRSTKNSKIAAKLDFQKDTNYKGQGKEGGWTLDFQLTGNPTFLTSKLPSLQSDKSGFPSFKLFLEENVKIRMGGMWTSVWSSDFGNNVEKLPSDSLRTKNSPQIIWKNSHTWGSWCIMHGLGHSSNDTWLIW